MSESNGAVVGESASSDNRRRRRQQEIAAACVEANPTTNAPSDPPELTGGKASKSDAKPIASVDRSGSSDPGSRRRRRQEQQKPDDDGSHAHKGESTVNQSDEAASRPGPVSEAVTAASRADVGSKKTTRAERRMQKTLQAGHGALLPDDERRLLEAPLKIERGDLYPSRAEPHFLIEPPAPALGEVSANYVELAGTMTFKCTSTAAKNDEELGTSNGTFKSHHHASATAALAHGPTGGTQFVMLCIGIAIHLAQGALAGLSLLQLALQPWPDDSRTLTRPMAYAPAAMATQRAMQILAMFAFIGAADLHAVNPRYASALTLVLYACVVTTLIIELPTDVALSVGRRNRETVLSEALDVSLGVGQTVLASDGAIQSLIDPDVLATQIQGRFRPELLAVMQLEQQERGFFSTNLSAQQLNFWQALIWTRAVMSTFCWISISLLQSGWAFRLPPFAVERGSWRTTSRMPV